VGEGVLLTTFSEEIMKYDFANPEGEMLSGRLELPAAAPRAFALFAHCFTCSKDFIAASVIAKTLAESGIGVLRFDFTGLGGSEGDFSNTNFTSNVEDLISGCNQLSKDYEAPQLLIGHSLGGAAVLKAATQLDSVKAVVTIAAPSDVRHISRLFEDQMETMEKEGQVNIKLGGRHFTIKKQFLDDIGNTEILDYLKGFRKALLVMHAPNDTSVSIDHAAKIFQAATHPKSFVSLDNADHLLSKRSDAKYAARVCAAWADRYISSAATE
jgi:alpha-beta hydrolase superfamily lysophospholipase